MGNYRITRRGKIVLGFLIFLILLGIYGLSYNATQRKVDYNDETYDEIKEIDKLSLPKLSELFKNNIEKGYTQKDIEYLKTMRIIIYFSPNSPELSEESKAIIQGFNLFEEEIIIEGNFNGHPHYENRDFGLKLAKNRAINTKKVLVEKGFKAENIKIINNGCKKPLNKDSSENELMKNRRVEVYYNYNIK